MPIKPLFGVKTQEKADIAVIGIPYDSSQSFFSGAKFGPTAIRLAANTLEEYSFIFRKDVRDLSISDWGDIEVSVGDFMKTKKRVFDVLRGINAEKYLFLGGDHSVTIITVDFLKDKIKRYVHVDAHADFEDEYLGNKFSHDSTLRRVGEMIGFEKITLLGFRSASIKELKALEDFEVETYSIFDILDDEEILPNVLKKADYLSIDIDVFEPSYAPEVGNPEPFGFTPIQFIKHIREISPRYVDIVEVTTTKMESITAILAATIAREILIAMNKS